MNEMQGWFAVGVGVVVCIVGALFVRFNDQIAGATAGQLNRFFTGQQGDSAAGRSTPARMRRLGIYFVVLGLVIAMFGVFAVFQPPS